MLDGRYNDMVARNNAALEAFEKMYAKRYPPPEKATATGWVSTMQLLLAFMTLAAIITSGAHTIPALLETFGKDSNPLIGLAAYASFDGALLAFGFLYVMYQAKNGALDEIDMNVMYWCRWGLLVIVVVLNVYHGLTPVLNGRDPAGEIDILPLWKVVQVVVTLLVGAAAPAIAFVAGEGFALETLEQRERAKRLDDAYQELLADWRENMLKDFDTKKARMGVSITVESAPVNTPAVHSLNSVNEPVNERTLTAANGYSKQMNARDVIRAYFAANPDAIGKNLDVLVSEISASAGVKIGRTSIHNVRNELKRGGE